MMISILYKNHQQINTGYRIAGTFEGKNFHEFHDFIACHPRKFSSRNFRHATPIMHTNSAKVFSAKCSLPTDPQKFSPSKVFRYTATVRSVALKSFNNKFTALFPAFILILFIIEEENLEVVTTSKCHMHSDLII